jgi:hypothetical protein
MFFLFGVCMVSRDCVRKGLFCICLTLVLCSSGFFMSVVSSVCSESSLFGGVDGFGVGKSDFIVVLDEDFEDTSGWGNPGTGFQPCPGWSSSHPSGYFWMDGSLFGQDAYSGGKAAYSITRWDSMISPFVSLGAGDSVLSFWYRAEISSAKQSFEVYVNGFSSGVCVWNDTDFNHETWVEAVIDFDVYAGQTIFIEFINAGDPDWYGLLVDDVRIVTYDTIPPEISSVNIAPVSQVTGGFMNISCIVTDNVMVDEVCVNVTFPDLSNQNISMIKSGDIFFANQTFDMIGDHRFFIWANDTSGNNDMSIGYDFTVEPIPNTPPGPLLNPVPSNGAIGVTRPISVLNITILDSEGDEMILFFRWVNHSGLIPLWENLSCWNYVLNGSYEYSPVFSKCWIWGNTTYTWSVNVTDGYLWTNETYTFTTKGSRYDINNDDKVNYFDALITWAYRANNPSGVTHDGLYDVNGDGKINYIDALTVWFHRGE